MATKRIQDLDERGTTANPLDITDYFAVNTNATDGLTYKAQLKNVCDKASDYLALGNVSKLTYTVVDTLAESIKFTDDRYMDAEGVYDHTLGKTQAVINKDYIVDQNINADADNWGYRKWSSGLAECWKSHRFTDATTGVNNRSLSLPFTFIDRPTATVSVAVTGDPYGYITHVECSTTHVDMWVYVHAASATTGDLHIHVIGRWN